MKKSNALLVIYKTLHNGKLIEVRDVIKPELPAIVNQRQMRKIQKENCGGPIQIKGCMICFP